MGDVVNDPAAGYPPLPSEGDIERVYPDLATFVLATASAENDQRTCGIPEVMAALSALGHSRAAVEAAIDKACQSELGGRAQKSSTTSTLTVPESLLANWTSLALALSGGGLRATLFELGIVLYLAIVDKLQNVRLVISVSGGSILAAHLGLHWKLATTDRNGFISVASKLVRFTQCNIRDSTFVPYIWSWLLALPLFGCAFNWAMSRFLRTSVFNFSRTAFLERAYRKILAERTLEELLPSDDVPRFAFVATDSIKDHRVVFMADGIRRFAFGEAQYGQTIFAEGVHLSLAVTASSCFPGVFGRMRLSYQQLGIAYDEFMETLHLSDGGVGGNLGVRVLRTLNQNPAIAKTVLLCDAETGLAARPGNNFLTDIWAGRRALSEAERDSIAGDCGANAELLSLKEHATGSLHLPRRVETLLRKYRTDLDKPSWQECEALMIHGAAICEAAFSSRWLEHRPSTEIIRSRIREVLAGAGAPTDLPDVDENALRWCWWPPCRRLVFHILVFALVVACIFEGIGILTGLPLRPLTVAYRFALPEPIIDRDLDKIAAVVAANVCIGTVANAEMNLIDGALCRVTIIAEATRGAGYLRVSKNLRPPGCDRDISCEFTFRGRFPKLNTGDTVTVVGRLDRISAERRRNAYIVFSECYAE
jgi:predicted acylesterase/phospholipase RssA